MMMSSGGDLQYFWPPPLAPPPQQQQQQQQADVVDQNRNYYYYMPSVSSSAPSSNNSSGSSSNKSSSNNSSGSSSPPHLPYANPDPLAIHPFIWSVAENAAHSILLRFHPTPDSHQKRKDVTDYLQNLFKSALKCEVVPYGSVPLRTYLPDGDIDLTALSNAKANEALASDFQTVLEKEQMNGAGNIQIQDVQYIGAEVNFQCSHLKQMS